MLMRTSGLAMKTFSAIGVIVIMLILLAVEIASCEGNGANSTGINNENQLEDATPVSGHPYLFLAMMTCRHSEPR